MELGLNNKRAAVAAASGGLGFAIARALGAEGCRVGICGRDGFRIERAAASLRDGTGSEIIPAVVDVSEAGAKSTAANG